MDGRSDETPTDYNCWIVEANYTPQEHKEPARTLQANTMSQNTACPYDASSSQTNTTSIQKTGSNESSIQSKGTRSSDETWAPDDNTSKMSPQEAAVG